MALPVMPTATLQSELTPTNNSLSQSQHGHPENLLMHTNRTGQTRDEFFNTRAEATIGHLTPTEEHSPTRSRISGTSLPFPVTSFPQNRHHSVFDGLRGLFLAISHNISTSVSLRRIYFYFLLLLPRHYFSRVAGVFCALDIDMAEIRRDALRSATYEDNGSDILEAASSHSIQSQKEDLQNAWEELISTLTREWETLNIVSVLLLSAILTVLQIETASSYPLTQFSAFFSLICALMSLLYGCMYIIRFGGLRKTLTWALEWASEAQQTRTPIFWNTWVMLAMPAAWLCWAIVFFIICIMSFIWHAGLTGNTDGIPLSIRTSIIPCSVISGILCLGIVYFLLIIRTFRRYGTSMDLAWRAKLRQWNRPPTRSRAGMRRFNHRMSTAPARAQVVSSGGSVISKAAGDEN